VLALFDGLELTLLIALVGLGVVLGIALVWIGDRVTAALGSHVIPLDPILGLPDQVAIFRSEEPFIPMPNHCNTHADMVAWMTQELPKLTAEIASPRK